AHVEVAAAGGAEQRAASALGGAVAEELRQRVELLGDGAAGFEQGEFVGGDRGHWRRHGHAVGLADARSGDGDLLESLVVLRDGRRTRGQRRGHRGDGNRQTAHPGSGNRCAFHSFPLESGDERSIVMGARPYWSCREEAGKTPRSIIIIDRDSKLISPGTLLECHQGCLSISVYRFNYF